MAQTFRGRGMKKRTIKEIIFLACILSVASVSAHPEALKSFERGSASVVTEPTGERTLISYEEDLKQDNRYTGEDWESITRLIENGDIFTGVMIKIALVRGIYEGAQTLDRAKTKEMYYFGVPYKVMVKGLDEFYLEKKNRVIPVAEALKITTTSMKGKAKKDIRGAVEGDKSSPAE